jgi:predicted TIM-barrel fold metal-dependent hydrolase
MNHYTKRIDCNVRQGVKSWRQLADYMAEPWKTHIAEFGLRLPKAYAPPGKADINPKYELSNHAAVNDPERLSAVFLEPYGIEYAILTGTVCDVSAFGDADYAAVAAQAGNDWLIEQWLSRHDAFLGSMTIATQDPIRAAREIERVGTHPRIVQISMSSGAQLPYGHRYYAPIYETASKLNLPIAIHAGNEGGGISSPPSSVGYVSDYFQFYSVNSHALIAHMVNLIGEGVCDTYPNLKFVLSGCGFSWLPNVMWRMDRAYHALRSTVPQLRKWPSDYIRDHFYITTQPLDESPDPEHTRQLLEMTGAEPMLLFASGYPAWDADDPTRILPGLSEQTRANIFYGNAKKLYRL